MHCFHNVSVRKKRGGGREGERDTHTHTHSCNHVINFWEFHSWVLTKSMGKSAGSHKVQSHDVNLNDS